MTTQTEVQENPLMKLVTTLELQHSEKKDIVLGGSKLEYHDGKLWVPKPMGAVGFDGFKPTDVCHDQIAGKLQIPVQYYKRMMSSNPELLEHNINSWLGKDEKIKYLLRAFGAPEGTGVARALLSDRFHILDNYDVLLAALEAIKEMKVNVKITKAEVTDRRMYLHVTCPEVEQDAEVFLRHYLRENDAAGNGIVSGLVITNSEVGLGTFEVRPRAVIVKCNNGLICKDESYKRIHLGSKMDEGAIEWSERTKKKNYELVISQTQDAVRTFLSPKYLGQMIERIAEAHQIVLEHPIDAVQNVFKELSISEDHKSSILKYFVEDGDSKASGIFQAVTRQAQAMSADDQYEIETNAFGILSKIKKFDKPFSKN